MGAKKTDISQIKDYLKGELDDRAMHQLERQAQDDPFLMDALDGYEKAGMPTQAIFDDLDKKLHQRIDKRKPGSVIPWRYLAAAASLLIVFSLGWLLWPTKQSPVQKQQLTAVQITPPPVDYQPVAPVDTVTKPAEKRQLTASATRPDYKQAPQKEAAPVLSQAVPLPTPELDDKAVSPEAKMAAAQPALKQESFFKNKSDSASLKEITITGLAKLTPKDIETNAGGERQTLQGKVNGVDFTTPQKINGTVLNDLGMALPGVNVKLQGTNVGTLTDEKGRFSVPANGQATLDIEQSGFVSKRITAGTNDSVKVKLQASTNEVAAGMAFAQAKPVKAAHPQMGFDAYNKYLQNQAISADGVSGIVRLSFSVRKGEGQQGYLEDFKIVKGLSDATNQQAINLIKNGPSWLPDVSGKTKTVELKIKFSRRKTDAPIN